MVSFLFFVLCVVCFFIQNCHFVQFRQLVFVYYFVCALCSNKKPGLGLFVLRLSSFVLRLSSFVHRKIKNEYFLKIKRSF